jgi:hypothetical protein
MLGSLLHQFFEATITEEKWQLLQETEKKTKGSQEHCSVGGKSTPTTLMLPKE